MGTPADDAAAEFHDFFERHYAELARLAHLLTGEADAADDLAADALLALWHRWDCVRTARHPAAYARGVVANLARSRIRSAVRERRRIALFWDRRPEHTDDLTYRPSSTSKAPCAACRSANAPAWSCATPSTCRSGRPPTPSESRSVR